MPSYFGGLHFDLTFNNIYICGFRNTVHISIYVDLFLVYLENKSRNILPLVVNCLQYQQVPEHLSKPSSVVDQVDLTFNNIYICGFRNTVHISIYVDKTHMTVYL
jgi:hypothetical protein